jgi:hypothetical protein
MEKMVRLPVAFKIPVSDDTKDFIRRCLEVGEERRIGLAEMKEHPFIKRILKLDGVKDVRNKEALSKDKERRSISR